MEKRGLFAWLKDQWETSPVIALLVLSWEIIPWHTRFISIGFIILLILYDIPKWDYKAWSGNPHYLRGKNLMNCCHRVLLGALVVLPMVCMLTYQAQDKLPHFISKHIVDTASNVGLSQSIKRYSFTQGTPHPQNHRAAYIGVTDDRSATLYEFNEFLHASTSNVVAAPTNLCDVALLICFLAIPSFVGFEVLFEKAPNASP